MIFALLLLTPFALLVYVYRHKIKQRINDYHARQRLKAWIQSPKINNAVIVIDEIYTGVNGMALSIAARQNHPQSNDTLLYGEAVLFSFADLLSLATPQKGDIFVDLGSGVGKVVFMAALLDDFSKAYGIELLPPLHETAQHCLERFLQSKERIARYPNKPFNIAFTQNDILKTDYRDANIIFINATAFHGIMWYKIQEQLKNLKVGARIIISTKALNEDYFKLTHHGKHLMSWGLAAVSVYEKIR